MPLGASNHTLVGDGGIHLQTLETCLGNEWVMRARTKTSPREDVLPSKGRLLACGFEYQAGDRVALHWHPYDQWVYAHRGVMRIEARAGTWLVPSHRAVWIPHGVVHAIEMPVDVSMRTLYAEKELALAPAACRVVVVTPLLRELVLRAVATGPAVLATSDRESEASPLAALILQEARATRDAELHGLHLPNPDDDRLERIAIALAAQPSDRRTLHEWGRDVGASPRTLSRLFVAETGLTFARWRQQLRLQVALKLLAEGASVTETAMAVGYHSLSAFVSLFQRSLGASPSTFRRSARSAAAERP